MNTELEKLKDIHLPQAVNMWPIAPGWIALYVLSLVLISYLIYFFYQRNKKRYTVKFALAKLKYLQNLMADNPENINIAVEISSLIRRTALHYFHREQIAGLAGNAWLDFLNRSGHTTLFAEETGRLLVDAPYCKNNTADLTPLFAVTKNWLMTIAKKQGLTAEK